MKDSYCWQRWLGDFLIFIGGPLMTVALWKATASIDVILVSLCFGVLLVAAGVTIGSKIYARLWDKLCELHRLTQGQKSCLEDAEAAIADLIEDGVADAVLYRNKQYFDEENALFFPMRLDRHKAEIKVTVQKRHGTLSDRQKLIFGVDIDLLRDRSKVINLATFSQEGSHQYSLLDLNDFIKELRTRIEGCKLPMP